MSTPYAGSMESDSLPPAPSPGGQSPNRPSLLRGGIAVGAAQATRLTTGLIIGVIVSRMLGPAAKGELSLLQQLPAIAALVGALGFDAAHAYFVGRHKADAGAAVSDSAAHTLLVAVVAVPALVLVMRSAVPALAAVPSGVLWLAAGIAPILVLSSLLGGILTGQSRLTQHAVAGIAGALVSLAAVVTAVAVGTLTVAVVVAGTLAGVAVAAALSAWGTGVRSATVPSLVRVRERWGYARASYVQSVTGYLELRQDVVLLGILGSAAGVGIYSVGASIAELLFYLPQVLASALTARALQEDAARGAALTASVTRLLVAALGLTAVVVALLARPLVVLVFGPAFAPAASVVWLLLPGIVIWGIASQGGAYLATHGRLFPRVSTATLFVNLGLNLALIPSLGPVGAAIATTISYSLVSGYIIRTFSITTETRLRDLLLVSADDIRYALAAARALLNRSG